MYYHISFLFCRVEASSFHFNSGSAILVVEQHTGWNTQSSRDSYVQARAQNQLLKTLTFKTLH